MGVCLLVSTRIVDESGRIIFTKSPMPEISLVAESQRMMVCMCFFFRNESVIAIDLLSTLLSGLPDATPGTQ